MNPIMQFAIGYIGGGMICFAIFIWRIHKGSEKGARV